MRKNAPTAWRRFCALGIALGLCSSAQAAFVNFYSITPNGTVGRMASTYNFGTVTAQAAETDGLATKYLTVANFSYPQPNEVGIGVCSASDTGSLCNPSINGNGATEQLNLNNSIWVGDTTEIDSLGSKDQLKLSVNAGSAFTGQFIIGSLDDNSGDPNQGFEDGYVMYGGNTVHFLRTATGATIDQGNATIVQAGSAYGFNVFLLTLGNFSPGTSQVTFGAGLNPTNTNGNNDYLVTAADIAPVPLPAAAWLMLSGLGGLGAMARRRRAA